MIRSIILFLTVCLVGCGSINEKESAGTVLGAAGGALIGAQIGHPAVVGGVIGALLGAVAGNALGRMADGGDACAAEEGFYKASRSPLGETVYWHNKETRHWGIL